MPTPATADPACLRSRLETWLAVFLIAAVLAFQAWTAWSTDRAWLVDGRRDDYNNQLLHSFLAGHLYLPETPDPRLAQLANPYDPALRPADVATPHDGSYYHGHFYMYFGVTPIVTLLLPWRLLVGHDLPQVWAVVFFVWGGFLAASALFLSLRRRFFPESGAVTLVAGLVVLGLGSMTHAVLRRSGVWEAAIAPGYCFAMLMLLCLYRGLHSCRPAGWLAAAGAAFGLAVGARPIYVLGGAALLVPLIRAAALGRRELIRQALALALGAGPIAAGLAWYNWARFGSPLEFGNHYMMNAANEQAAVHFSLRYLPYNFYAYFLAPLPFGRYFPFVGLARLPAQPDGYYGVEYVSGLLVNFPFAWLAVLVPLGWRGRAAAEAGELRRFLTALAIFFAGVAALEACWWAATARYMADFTPALMLLAAAGMLGAERAARGRGRALVRTGAAAAALFTAFVGAMLSFQLHELLRQLYPQTFDRVAHVFDTPVAWVERLAGERFEPREITLRFPIGKGGLVEPLVTAGWEFQSDHLFVHYYDAGHVRFGYDHAGHGALWSGPVPVDYGATHRLRVAMGSFYPPRAHPFYNGHTAAYAELKTRNLFLSLDGRVILNSLVNFYDTSPGTVIYGRDPIGLLPYPFSGRILSVRKIADSFPLPFQTGYGEIELTFTMPAEALGRVLPLVSSGVSGRGDILRFREVRRGWVRFGYDHWGLALWESDEIPLDPSGPHRLRLRLPALMPASAFALPAAVRESLLLEIDGSTVWLQRLPFYPAAPEQIYLGRNALGASTCEGELPGGIAEASRIASPPLVPAAARGPVVLELRLPEDLRAGTRDPLISAGGVGRADMLSVEYAAAGQVRFLLDHWGSEGARSPLIAIDYAKVHSLEINWPGLGGAAAEAGREIGGKVSVQIDGQPVWTAPAKFYAARSGDISIAENPLGASTCGPAFTGALARVQWLDFPGASP